MAPFARCSAERDTFDDLTHEAVHEGNVKAMIILDVVAGKLLKLKQPWAVALARSAIFRSSLRNSLIRLSRTGRVKCDGHGHLARWSSIKEP